MAGKKSVWLMDEDRTPRVAVVSNYTP